MNMTMPNPNIKQVVQQVSSNKLMLGQVQVGFGPPTSPPTVEIPASVYALKSLIRRKYLLLNL